MLWTDGKMGNPSSAGQVTMRIDHYCPDQCASHAIRFQIVNHDLFFVKNVIVALNIRRIGQMEWLMCFGNPAICYRILRWNDTNNKSMRKYARGDYLRLPIRCLCWNTWNTPKRRGRQSQMESPTGKWATVGRRKWTSQQQLRQSTEWKSIVLGITEGLICRRHV